jgi:hypothetical protein
MNGILHGQRIRTGNAIVFVGLIFAWVWLLRPPQVYTSVMNLPPALPDDAGK